MGYNEYMHNYDYHATDENGNKINVFIECRRIKDPQFRENESEGMEIFPSIFIQDNDILPEKFRVVTWGSPLRCVLDVLEIVLEICPCVIDLPKKNMWFNRLKKKVNSLDLDLHPDELKELREGKLIRIRNLSTTEHGKFYTDFVFDFHIDSDINKAFPSLFIVLTHIDLEAKKFNHYYDFKILNIANFYCNLKHFDPRLGKGCEDYCSFTSDEDKKDIPCRSLYI